MKTLITHIVMLFLAISTYAQNTYTYKAIIKNAKTHQPLHGATVKVQNTNLVTVSEPDGLIVLSNIPSGKQIIEFSYVGYIRKTDTLTFPINNTTPLLVTLEIADEHEELDEVVISATRSTRTIDNIPTRVEVIAGEELDEKGNMKPGDIRMLLAESTGIQTQQTSATSGNSSIRIQGLDGK